MREHLKRVDLGGLFFLPSACAKMLRSRSRTSGQQRLTILKKIKKEEEKTQREMRKEIAVILNLCYSICVGFSFKANGTGGRCESWDDPS